MMNDIPVITDAAKIKQNKDNIERLYSYLEDFISNFENAVGEAIDPTEGGGGDGSITIDEPPSNIVYTPGSGLSVDGNLFGHIDISYVKPRFAVSIAVRYRELGSVNFRTTDDEASPFRLTNLKVSSIYEVQLAGKAANGVLGPFSVLTTVVIPTVGSFAKAPADALYWVGAANSNLTNEVIPTGEATVVTVAPTTAVISLTANGVSNAKLAQMAALTLKGNNTVGVANVLDLTVAQALSLLLNGIDTGWSVTNVTPDRSYDATLTTSLELAHVLGTLINVLVAKGVLSA
jgi:hypothetical protein